MDFLTPRERKELSTVLMVSSQSYLTPTSILHGCRLRSSPEEDENSAVPAAPGATDTLSGVPVGAPLVISAQERLEHQYNNSDICLVPEPD